MAELWPDRAVDRRLHFYAPRFEQVLPHDRTARVAQAILAFRHARASVLPPELFAETGWEFLLELFVADAAGEHLTGGDVARNIRVPHNIASRWMMFLSKAGLIIGDGQGDLTDSLVLSPKAIASVEAIVGLMADLGRQIENPGQASYRS